MRKFVSPYGATSRRNFVLVVLILCASTVVARIGYLQIYNSDYLEQQGNNRFIRIKREPALRGMIFDRNGIPLAVSTPVSSIWANPKEINNDKETIQKIATATRIPFNELLKKFTAKSKKSFLYIKRAIPPNVAKEIIKQKIHGLYEEREYKRFYPSADITSQVIGFTNIDDKGQEGIELSYENLLAGVAGATKVLQDRSGKVFDILEEITPSSQGQDITLTIDKRIQFLTYQALLEAVKEHQAKSASAVVLDAKTSEILAMVSVPSGNPNNVDERKASLIKNRALTDTYEPGSVIKPFSIAAALDAGVVTPNTEIDTNPGYLRVGRNLVRDVHNYGDLDVRGVIQKSSNVGTCEIALKTPREKIHSMFQSVGFGKKTAIGFPGEQKGTLNHFDNSMGDFEYCTNAFGYAISVTTLQIAQSYAVLANDGLKIPVSLIKSNTPAVPRQVISKKTALEIKEMLSEAASIQGTGSRATRGQYIEDYRVGGKTGTAHKVINGKYSKDKYRSTFAGIAPIDNPRIVMAVVVDEPSKGGYYGALVAAPVFGKVVGKVLRIKNVPPEKHQDIIKNNQEKLL